MPGEKKIQQHRNNNLPVQRVTKQKAKAKAKQNQ